MCNQDAWSIAQACAQAMHTVCDLSNARTYARDLQRTTYVDLLTYVSNARGGAGNA